MEIKTYGVKIVPLKAKCWGVKIFPPKGKSFKFGNVPAVLVNNILTDDDKEDMPIFTAIGEGKETSDRENYVCAVVIEKMYLVVFTLKHIICTTTKLRKEQGKFVTKS